MNIAEVECSCARIESGGIFHLDGRGHVAQTGPGAGRTVNGECLNLSSNVFCHVSRFDSIEVVCKLQSYVFVSKMNRGARSEPIFRNCEVTFH